MQKIIPECPICGTVQVPPSKSMAHRLLIGAALCDRESRIQNIGSCADVLATADCLQTMGAQVQMQNGTAIVRGPLCKTGTLHCADSASTLRFLLPLCLLQNTESVLCGSAQLLRRPMEIFEKLCAKQGLFYKTEPDGIRIRGKLQSGTFSIPGNVSSQFISGLLFALPFLQGDSTVQLLPPVESAPYIRMTMEVLSRYGIQTLWQNDRIFVPGNQTACPSDSTVEGDWSAAAYIAALGENVTVTGLLPDSLQGDKIYPQYFDILRSGCPTLDVRDCPDLAPVLTVLAAVYNGAALTGTARLRLKESDRITCMQAELHKCGVSFTAEENCVRIAPGIRKPTEPLFAHGDHRIAMALAAILVRVGGILDGAEAVQKSFPDFWDVLNSLRNEGTNT